MTFSVRKTEGEHTCSRTYQVQSSGEDGGVRYGPRLAAVQQELEALHALSNGAQIHYVLVLHGLLAGRQTLLKAVRSWRNM